MAASVLHEATGLSARLLAVVNRPGGGFAAAISGVGLIVGLLVADANTDACLWRHGWFPVAFGLACLIVLLGVYVGTSPFTGWPLPQTHDVRQEKREAARQEERLRRYLLLDALNEFHDELDHTSRRLMNEAQTGRRSGAFHPADAWAQYRHLIAEHGLDEERELAREAYERTDAVNRSMQERTDAADQNDPLWMMLSDDERRERQEALEAVNRARDAFSAAKDTYALTPRKITVRDDA